MWDHATPVLLCLAQSLSMLSSRFICIVAGPEFCFYMLVISFKAD